VSQQEDNCKVLNSTFSIIQILKVANSTSLSAIRFCASGAFCIELSEASAYPSY